jgi:hypothetical protein
MNTRINIVVGLMGVFGVGSAAVAACPITPVKSGTNNETGHYYEVYAANAFTWDEASACAAIGRAGPDGRQVTGHLATLTSSSEDSWVDGLRKDSASFLTLPEVWVGGYQPTGNRPNYDGPPNPDEPGLGWQWVNNEGPFPGVNNGTVYANWNGGEPNNAGGSENHLALGRYAPSGGWNDEDSDLTGATPGAGIGGYIVEYDFARVVSACNDATRGCTTINGQTLKFPQQWIDQPTDTIKFTAYEFTDPRVVNGRCNGTDSLKLFEYLDLQHGSKTLYIPPYLCGSPKIVVVAVDGSDLNFQNGGTVLIENDTATVLPGNKTPANAVPPNVPYVCENTTAGSANPVYPVKPGDDPQYQDVVVYQTTDPGNMLENPSTNPSGPPTSDPQFIGAASEVTNGCGSGKGSGKELSYIVVGMHIDFGPGYALSDYNTGLNHDRFVALTRYKLTLLQQSVGLAKSTGALKSGVATLMSAALVGAVKKLDRGDPRGALCFVEAFLKLVNAAKYSPATDGNNYNGEHLMRGTNIDFTLRVKVIPPYTP